MSRRVTERIKQREAALGKKGYTPAFGDPPIKQEGATIDRFTGEVLKEPKPKKPAVKKSK